MDYSFETLTRCWQIYDEIRQTDELNEKLLSAMNQLSLFIKVMERATASDKLLLQQGP